MIRHAWPQYVGSGGVVGVVAFFALSGYLITGILQRDVNRFGRVRYGRFYRNRAIRLIAPMVVLLITVCAVLVVVDPLDENGSAARAFFAGITYTMNLPYDHGTAMLSHLWTLATEEQFYIVWPILLTVAIKWRRIGHMFIGVSLALVIAMAITMYAYYPDTWHVYSLPTSWAIAMVIGAAVKIWEPSMDRQFSWAARRPGVVGGVVVAVLMVLSFVPEDKNSPWTYFLLGPAIALLTMVLVLSWKQWRQIPSKMWRPVLALGTISYAAYLWNYPITLWLGAKPLPIYMSVLSIALTIAAATLSWFLVEKPLQRWKLKLDSARKM